MEENVVEEQESGEACPRCLQPLPPNSTRCLNCGQPIANARRLVPIVAGICGVLALIFLFIVMYRVVYLSDLEQAPPIESEAPPAFAPPPETSAGHEAQAPEPAGDKSTPAPDPQKKAPLDR